MDVALLYTNGPDQGQRIVLSDEITILGKGADCDVRVPSNYISRQHCQIARTGQQVIVHDLASKNGTYVNGQRITSEAIISDGDELAVGRITFSVLIGDHALEEDASNGSQRTVYSTLVAPLVGAIESGDALFAGFAARTRTVAQLLATRMGVDPYQAEDLAVAAMLANIAMTRIPREIVYSRDPLTEPQWSVVKQHPEEAVRILAAATLQPEVVAGIRHHHERYDGSGYPDGLSRDEIPWIARIVGVSEAIVAMASERPYRKPMDREAIRLEIQHNAGVQFDPEAAAAGGAILLDETEPVSSILWGT